MGVHHGRPGVASFHADAEPATGGAEAVTLAPRGYPGAEGGFRRIGVAFLDTADGREALATAVTFAMLRGAELTAFTRGYGPLRTVLLGGVSGRLAHTAACPLLVIPRSADRASAGARRGRTPAARRTGTD
jgi:hypothetical protein